MIHAVCVCPLRLPRNTERTGLSFCLSRVVVVEISFALRVFLQGQYIRVVLIGFDRDIVCGGLIKSVLLAIFQSNKTFVAYDLSTVWASPVPDVHAENFT